ncbi:reverse transcriptase domain-containing protein [Tanacetum coccineum]|uniref:Reverse transcriptase domain-containing protein n=1 Tax=Tanacetum coccineum TaxID=301880 RepID=A0ABQ4ZGT2_9ASTR
MRKLIAELPTLKAPMKDEETMVYLSAANEAVCVVLVVERNRRQMPICNSIAARRGGELRSNEKASSGTSTPDTMTRDDPNNEETAGPEKPSDQKKAPKLSKSKEKQMDEADTWKSYTDGASNDHRSGAGLILIDPEGMEYSYALWLNFGNSNNNTEYEALLAGLRMTVGIKENKKADALSKLAAVQCEGLTKGVLVEELNEQSVDVAEVNVVVEEERRTWMIPIREYIENGTLPEDPTEARTIREKRRAHHARRATPKPRKPMTNRTISFESKHGTVGSPNCRNSGFSQRASLPLLEPAAAIVAASGAAKRTPPHLIFDLCSPRDQYIKSRTMQVKWKIKLYNKKEEE